MVDDEVVEAIFKSIDPETKHALVLHAVCSTGCKDEMGPVPVSYHLTRAQAERELEAHRQAMFEYEREQFNIAQDMKLNPMDPKERFKLFYEFAIREVVVQRPDDGDYSPFIAPRD